jgi:hypothetical protein
VADVDALADAAIAGDHRAVAQLCELRSARIGAVIHAITSAQREIGRRWLTGAITVADEHRATSVFDRVLAQLELAESPAPSGSLVVSACVEGEWHVAAARSVALVAAASGHRVICLGASVPAADLATFVARERPAAVALSCSAVAALPGAGRCIAAVAGVGVPVAVGGHAFHAVPSAASALGFEHLDDPRDLLDRAVAPETIPALGSSDVLALDAAESRVIADAAAELGGSRVALGAATHLVGFVRAGVFLSDPGVVRGHRDWLDAYLSARGSSHSADDVVTAVRASVDRNLDGDRAVLAALE